MRTRLQTSPGVALMALLIVFGCEDDSVTPPPPQGEHFKTFQNATLVIGHANMISGGVEPVTAASLAGPFGAPAGDGPVYIADPFHNRILGFNAMPAASGAAADFVIGQDDFSSMSSGTTATRFHTLSDCAVADGRLFAVDTQNRRVLIWNTLPTANVPADVVVGQVDFTTVSGGTTASRFLWPVHVAVAGSKMFLCDVDNNRVLIWNSIPSVNDTPADVVVGQADFESGDPGLSASRLADPHGLWTDGERLVISDGDNDRVLIWKSIPTSNDAPADLVVGASDLTTAGSVEFGAGSVGESWGVASDGQSLFVATSRHSVLVFDPFPVWNGAHALIVLGQKDFNHYQANDDNQDSVEDATPSPRTFKLPTGLRVIGNRLYVSDLANNRIVAFDRK